MEVHKFLTLTSEPNIDFCPKITELKFDVAPPTQSTFVKRYPMMREAIWEFPEWHHSYVVFEWKKECVGVCARVCVSLRACEVESVNEAVFLGVLVLQTQTSPLNSDPSVSPGRFHSLS